jgi:hypothetical protein
MTKDPHNAGKNRAVTNEEILTYTDSPADVIKRIKNL